MINVLLCSQEPLLSKGLYGPLRDEGYRVDMVEHPADAVRWFLNKPYDAVVIDSRDIGLNAFEAASIMKNISSDTKIFLFSGKKEQTKLFVQDGIVVIDTPVELDRFIELFKEIIRTDYRKGGVYDTKRDYSRSV